MKKRKAKRLKRVNGVASSNLNGQIDTSSFSDAELAFLNLIAEIIVRISIAEFNETNKSNDESE